MDKTMMYAEILAQVLREESKCQPRLQPVRIVSVCDHETREYLLVATGWENKRRLDTILFHARLMNGKVLIESDNIEEGLKPKLIEAGIAESDIISRQSRRDFEKEEVAA